MSDRLPPLTPADLDQEQLLLYRAITGGARAQASQSFSLTNPDGSLVGPFGLMLHAPLLGQPLQELGAAVRFRTGLTDRQREIAILTVADALGSEFEWWSHRLVGLAAGLSELEVEAIQGASFAGPSGADPTEAVVHDVARHLVTAGSLDDLRYASAVDALGERGLVELVILVGYYRMLALMLEVFEVGTPQA